MDGDAELREALCLALATSYGLEGDGRPQEVLGAARSAREWLTIDEDHPALAELRPRVRARLRDPCLRAQAAELEHEARRLGLDLLWRGHAAWPAGFDALCDPPWVMWCEGRLEALDEDAVTVVGSRHPSPYGVHATDRFVEALCLAGLGVWSGLARGIDGQAHRAALTCRGTAVAVLGSGLRKLYPQEHADLARQLLDAGGLLLSELPPGFRPTQYAFPRRNRLLAAGTLGTLVIEAGLRSGTTITAEQATALGRSVWAVPGPFASPTSAGCHALIRDGALLADSPEGLLDDLGLAGARAPAGDLVQGSVEAMLLGALYECPHRSEALATRLERGLDEVLVLLDGLEGRGRVERRPGGLWALRPHAGRAGSGPHGHHGNPAT